MSKAGVLNRFNLRGRTALITGGAGMLGWQHAEAILEAGGRVVLVDINGTALEERLEVLRRSHGKAVFGFRCDITSEEEVAAAAGKTKQEAGPVDILINNAAHNPTVKKEPADFSRFENFPLQRWQEDLAVGVTGAFLMSRAFGYLMVERGRGVIINILSDLAVIAPDQRIYRKPGLSEAQQPVKPVSYSVAKHALLGLTKYLATYWAGKGVRVNAISPGGVYVPGMDEVFVRKLLNLIPMGRMARVDEYKGVIVFLCSDASSYMTGTNIVMEGGRTCW